MNCRANINVTLVFVFPSKSNEFLPSYFFDLFVALRFLNFSFIIILQDFIPNIFVLFFHDL